MVFVCLIFQKLIYNTIINMTIKVRKEQNADYFSIIMIVIEHDYRIWK